MGVTVDGQLTYQYTDAGMFSAAIDTVLSDDSYTLTSMNEETLEFTINVHLDASVEDGE